MTELGDITDLHDALQDLAELFTWQDFEADTPDAIREALYAPIPEDNECCSPVHGSNPPLCSTNTSRRPRKRRTPQQSRQDQAERGLRHHQLTLSQLRSTAPDASHDESKSSESGEHTEAAPRTRKRRRHNNATPTAGSSLDSTVGNHSPWDAIGDDVDTDRNRLSNARLATTWDAPVCYAPV